MPICITKILNRYSKNNLYQNSIQCIHREWKMDVDNVNWKKYMEIMPKVYNSIPRKGRGIITYTGCNND